ncbi:MAG TPA: tetratricopeptide repeat protein, partial [Chthonomonadaceae bacterium]|nr:tetratricopeptide repeat protein [Chthonomonadaceae bacterium]
AAAVVEICRQLDGIPLALEMAAARVRSLSIEEIRLQLEHRFRFLVGGSRTALPRHRTLHAMLGWSYDLLNSQEQRLLSQLSVFSGGWTLSAAEGVCEDAGIQAWEILDLLSSLVDKSLVLVEAKGSVLRYRMLETVRKYAEEKLVEHGEVNVLRDRHRDWSLALAKEAEPKLAGPEQREWLERLEIEHDNLREALRWCAQGAEGGLRLAGALTRFWMVRGYLREGREHLMRELGSERAQARTETRAKALNAAGVLAVSQGDFQTARVLYKESIAISRELGDRSGLILSLGNLGLVVHAIGEYDVARVLYEESIATGREMGDKRGITTSLLNMGGLAWGQGNYTEARVLYEESLAIHKELGDKGGIANSLVNLCALAAVQGDIPTARMLCEESLALKRELGDRSGVADALNNLGALSVQHGDYAAAKPLYEEGLIIHWELGDRRGVMESLEGIAGVSWKLAEARTSVLLWGAVHSLRNSLGLPRPLNKLERYDNLLQQLRSALGSDAFVATWEEGCAMLLEQAVAYALELVRT